MPSDSGILSFNKRPNCFRGEGYARLVTSKQCFVRMNGWRLSVAYFSASNGGDVSDSIPNVRSRSMNYPNHLDRRNLNTI